MNMNLALAGLAIAGVGAAAAAALVVGRRKKPPPPPASVPNRPTPTPVPEPDFTSLSVPPPEDAFDDPVGQSEPEAVPLFADEDAGLDQPTAEVSLLLVSAAGTSDPGKKRTSNEDSLLELPEKMLYAVADGMGGHAAGEVASRIAVDTLADAYRANHFEGRKYPDLPRRAGELAQAIQEANRRIWERAREETRLNGMGTTLVGALFSLNKERLYIGHVGDSRCYRLRGSALTQLTADHTLGALGLTGQYADRLARVLGAEPAVTIDVVTARIDEGDTYLLCSDGLSKMASDEDIREVLSTASSPDDAVRGLVEKANAAGGKDNITVIVVRVEQYAPRPA
jgi:protein phosphatase